MNILLWFNQRPLRMLWQVEKNGRTSHIVGTAHFFPYSFERAFTYLMRGVQTVLFEGPLDETSSAQIAEVGRNGETAPTFVEKLTPETIREIDRILRDRLDGQRGDAWYLSLLDPKPVYFEAFTKGVHPWAAFFSIWQTFLDWDYSMDLEAYQLARRFGKQIHYLETLNDQIAVLDSISPDHIARQLNDVKNWNKYKTDYVKTFLAGDLEGLMSLSARVATRGPVIVGRRDRIFFEEMKPIFERENSLAFIGFPHVPGVSKLFSDEGYTVTQVRA
jgi:uncharacterized protein YbaP (TraB family)